MVNDDSWLSKLSRLNPATGRGPRSGKAPHKPILLLALLDAFDEGELESRVFTKTPNLVVRFLSYSAITADRWPGKLKVGMPFFHLSSQGFWKSFTASMEPATVDSAIVNEFDEEFYQLCQEPGFRLKARLLLISTYFTPAEKVALFAAVGLGSQRDAALAREVVKEADEAAAAENKGRSTRFRSNVVIKYHRTCALTGYRCDTVSGSSIVDAAHIVPFSETQDDELENGLTLSKSAHWMFDEGLWTVDDELRIIVNENRFDEAGPDAFLLRNFKGRHLQFDPKATLRPSLTNIQKHRARCAGEKNPKNHSLVVSLLLEVIENRHRSSSK